MNIKQIGLYAGALAVLVVVFAWLGGVGVAKVQVESAAAQSQYVGTTYETKVETVTLYREFSGQMVARNQATVASRMLAQVVDILVEAGDHVQQGDVLVRLDSDDLSARVRQQSENLAAAQARVNEARSQYQRVAGMVTQKLLPEARLDEVTAQRDTAEAQLRAAQEGLKEAQTTESYSVLVAPFDGVVSDRSVFIGDIASPGMTLLQLYQPSGVRFEAAVNESLFHQLQLHQVLPVFIDSLNTEFEAQIVEIVPTADSATRSFKVRLALPIEQDINPGFYGRLAVPVAQQEMILLPLSTVTVLGQLHYTSVLEQGKAERRFIRLGDYQEQRNGETWVQVSSGVYTGDRVVLPSS